MSGDLERPAQCEAIADDLTELALGTLAGHRRAEVLEHVNDAAPSSTNSRWSSNQSSSWRHVCSHPSASKSGSSRSFGQRPTLGTADVAVSPRSVQSLP